ncbi:MAG: matrixin family metalloprotease [Pirellulales bacterium]|nr:matrixin family metalloprotease [Pirellulales bacterium]
MSRFLHPPWILSLLIGLWTVQSASGFIPYKRWTDTASGWTGSAGDPITLTWSFIPDGTDIPVKKKSDLISFLDTTFGIGDGGSDLTQRPWFEIFEQSFNRWSQLAGITYIYEPKDDGHPLSSFSGWLGRRGDIRIGGTSIDGASGTLAYNYYPDDGDMVIDTGDASYFSNGYGNYLRLRNTIMHENGHGLGLDHVESDTSNFLMEPYISTLFDGPQFDDIRGMQWFYGDALEKEHLGEGNDSAATASDLGLIADGETVRIGLSAGSSTYVPSTAADFVSIDRNSDVDYFSFTIAAPSIVDVTLIPRGPTFDQGPEGGAQTSINTMAIGDLALSLYDFGGLSLLAMADETGTGSAEKISSIHLEDAGEYFVRVSATSDDNIQFYRLDIAVEAIIDVALADFDEDGDIDAFDFNTWQDHFGLETGAMHTQGDADGDGDVDGADFLEWQRTYPNPTNGFNETPLLHAIPEPVALTQALLLILTVLCRRQLVANRPN